MKMKKFIAKDMRQALQLVRSALGNDAVIISDKKVPQGIEITAATDDDFDSDSFVSETKNQQPQWDNNPDELDIKSEISALKDLVTHQLAGLSWHQSSLKSPMQIQIAKRLNQLGYDTGLIRNLIHRIPESATVDEVWSDTMVKLSEKLNTPQDDIINQSGIFALIGPTGVGKTTTVAKLAARYVLQHGAQGLGLITCDNYRIGAVDQLRTYGNILGVTLRTVDDAHSLQTALYDLRDKKLVLIDTVGVSQRDQRLLTVLNNFSQQGRHINTLLVLACTSHRFVITECIKSFYNDLCRGIILTKLDESSHLSEIISVLIHAQLPLLYTSSGQRVPEDLQLARSESLIQSSIDIARQYYHAPREEVLAHVFAEGLSEYVA
jgi:flagellar biosynthesis protein FlhF